MLETVARLSAEFPNLVPCLARRREIDDNFYAQFEQDREMKPIHVNGDSYGLLHSADVSLVSSGTATLEAALCGRPFCVVYRTGWITYQIARRVIKLDKVGLVNIVAGEKIVPEFLQNEMTPENLVRFCSGILSGSTHVNEMIMALKLVRAKLGEPGASKRAADLVMAELQS